MDQTERTGRVLSCVGGRYTVYADGLRFSCYAKGNFRHKGLKPKAGDFVRFIPKASFPDDGTPLPKSATDDGLILEIMARKNELSRPDVANVDQLLIAFSPTQPAPDFLFLDRLCALCAANDIVPVLLCNKKDLAPEEAKTLCALYENAGYQALCVCAPDLSAQDRARLRRLLNGKVTALAGNSGVGKTTLFNALFPAEQSETNALSEKIMRGKNTTRTTVLYPLARSELKTDADSFIADTPGFSRLAFEVRNCPRPEELAFLFCDFLPYVTKCRYVKCTHRVEDGCALLAAVNAGLVAASRHESYRALYDELRDLNKR